MQRDLTDAEVLAELERVAEAGLNHHLSVAGEWHPHKYVPRDLGRNYAAICGQDWAPEQSRLPEVAKVNGHHPGRLDRHQESPPCT